MVKKLFKHEFRAFSRTLIPVELILLGVAALVRMVYLFENDSTYFSVVGTSSVIMLVLAVIAAIGITFFLGVARFYRNLFTHEGYLSFTLPVGTVTHIFVKLAVSVIYSLITLLCVIVSISIASAGDLLIELWRSAIFLLGKVFATTGTANGIFYVIEMIFLGLAMLIHAYMLWYACLTIGQLSRKNRILLAIGVFFIAYVIRQVAGTVMVIILEMLVITAWFRDFASYVFENIFTFVHIGLCGLFVFEILISVIYFLITRFIISRKLNLE